MTPREFDEWVDHHADCIGGFREWLARDRTEYETSKVLSLWQQALADVSLNDAKAASMAIFRGDVDVSAFGNHPKAIRIHAKSARGNRAKKQRKFIGGQEVFDCGKCVDSGFIRCYHPVAINEVLKNRLECVVEKPHPTGKPQLARTVMLKMATCAYACDKCDVGRDKCDLGHTVFDERYCVTANAIGLQDAIRELFDGVDLRVAAGVSSRDNYSPEFSEWNSGG